MQLMMKLIYGMQPESDQEIFIQERAGYFSLSQNK